MSSQSTEETNHVSRNISRAGVNFQVIEKLKAGADFSAFWSNFSNEIWEPDTLEIIKRYALSGSVFLDVGAWIGPTTLWAAAHGAVVHSFEPDPIALKALSINVHSNTELSGKISIIPCAASDTSGDLEIYSSSLGNSETSVFPTVSRHNNIIRAQTKITVPKIDISNYVRQIGPQNNKIFMKMDIEGGEFDLLPKFVETARKYHIDIYATIHPQNLVKESEVESELHRALATIKVLSEYLDFDWSQYRNGIVHRLDNKANVLRSIMNNKTKEFNILLSRNSNQ